MGWKVSESKKEQPKIEPAPPLPPALPGVVYKDNVPIQWF